MLGALGTIAWMLGRRKLAVALWEFSCKLTDRRIQAAIARQAFERQLEADRWLD